MQTNYLYKTQLQDFLDNMNRLFKKVDDCILDIVRTEYEPEEPDEFFSWFNLRLSEGFLSHAIMQDFKLRYDDCSYDHGQLFKDMDKASPGLRETIYTKGFDATALKLDRSQSVYIQDFYRGFDYLDEWRDFSNFCQDFGILAQLMLIPYDEREKENGEFIYDLGLKLDVEKGRDILQTFEHAKRIDLDAKTQLELHST